jgi:hypothetical protein
MNLTQEEAESVFKSIYKKWLGKEWQYLTGAEIDSIAKPTQTLREFARNIELAIKDKNS